MDFGNIDIEEMILTAYDSFGDFIGQEHFVAQFAEAAICGTIAFPNMQYVAFNYTNTQYGFYGIDNLDFEPVPIPGAVWLLGSGLAGLVGLGRKAKK